MNGIELAKKYYEAYGIAMLEEQFGNVSDRIAIGLVGEGSECLGYDDAFSQDHDFEPGFCLWITAADERKFGFKLERAYTKLPKTFLGYTRSPLSPVGGNRHGVLVIEDFYRKFLGTEGVPETFAQWFSIPSATLRAAVSGQVWKDDLGAFSAVREALQKGYPRDVQLKKLAAHTIMMNQSGQYNLERCLARGEIGAAQLCTAEFVRHAISAVYLLNNVYEPFYKWAYRGMREFPVLSELEELLTALPVADDKPALVEQIAVAFAREFCNQGISDSPSNALCTHAYAITNKIQDVHIRNMHVMEGI